MKKIGFLLMLTKLEKQSLQKIADLFGYNLSEYMRRKLFNENDDLDIQGTIYISPEIDKHRVLNISLLYKLLYLNKEILLKQGCSMHEIASLEQKSLEFARQERKEDGYKVIENNHE